MRPKSQPVHSWDAGQPATDLGSKEQIPLLHQRKTDQLVRPASDWWSKAQIQPVHQRMGQVAWAAIDL